MYTPDGQANYPALWTRDFAYMVENCANLIPLEDIEAGIRYLLKGQSSEGVIPDRVEATGNPIYSAGPSSHPLGRYNLDNGAFLVIAVDEYARLLAPEQAVSFFCGVSAQLGKGLLCLPRSENGLIYNDPLNPHSPYGFTDCVGKTGELFMESLLFWSACRRMADWLLLAGKPQDAFAYSGLAQAIENTISELWDDREGLFVAATIDCRQVDIWANAYALYIDFPLDDEKKASIASYFASGQKEYAYCGQIRHLRKGEYWQRLLVPIEKERYQNGAYWATPTGWVMDALARTSPTQAQSLFEDLMTNFHEHGVCECINDGYYKLPTYVVSATNPLSVARRLFS